MTERLHRTLGGLVAVLCLTFPRVVSAQDKPARQPEPPRELRAVIGYAPLVLPDGTLEHYYTQGQHGTQELMCIRSKDAGASWSEPQRVRALPAGKFPDRSPVPLLDRAGNLHLFFQDLVEVGGIMRHTRRNAADQSWTPFQAISPKVALTPPVQLKSGRIVVQTGYFAEGKRAWDAVTGKFEITTYTSDDAGTTWQRSPQTLRVPNFNDFPGAHNGGAEPSLFELKDGRLWMTIRTQNRWLYESFSDDGIRWTEPQPTDFRSSESPASVVRLPSGEIVLVWNNCDNPSPVNGQWIYTGRDALHAAVSSDEGKTWTGYREVYLDPYRNDDPPPTGDRGTAYANAAAAPDGSVYLVSGQGPNPRGDGGKGRTRMFRINPAWLRLTTHADDFSQGLDGWSVFKSYGPAATWRRARVAGPERIAHPSKRGAWVLHVRRPDEKAGDGAAWNFPSGRTGSVTLRIRLNKGFAGGLITLTDRFIYPDDADLDKVAFALALPVDGRIGPDAKLTSDEWRTLQLAWKVEHKPPRGGWPGKCVVSLDGRQALTLPQLNRAKAGLSYLRLHSTAPGIDTAGFLVERVSAEIESMATNPPATQTPR